MWENENVWRCRGVCIYAKYAKVDVGECVDSLCLEEEPGVFEVRAKFSFVPNKAFNREDFPTLDLGGN